MPEQYIFKLYIAGDALPSTKAVRCMRAICGGPLDGECTLHIIDVLDDPAAAEAANVLATPTLIRESPSPTRRLVGDLCDQRNVLAALGITLSPEPGGDTPDPDDNRASD